ncbi:hypothetical protein Tco_0189066 [Tanacetum coccineum]
MFWSITRYDVFTLIGYGVSNFLYQYSVFIQQTDTAYSNSLNMAYRSSDTATERITMTKVIKEEFKQLGLLKISDDLFTYDTQLGMIFNEFNRLSGINNDLFTYKIKVPKPTPCDEQKTSNPTHNDIGEYKWKMSYEECEQIYAEVVIFINKRLLQLEEYLEIKKQRDTYAREVDTEYNPSNLVFAEWLASKFYNHLEMDWYTKNALWVYWMRGDDEVILSDEEVSDLKDKNNNDEQEIAEIFRIETNLFDYERPFELNNEDNEPWSKNGVQYEICDHICEPYRFKNGKAKWPICNSNEDGFYNEGELPGMVRFGYMTYFQDYERYDELVDGNLKE